MLFKPMLAVDCDPDKLRFPLLASAKLDGIRAIVRDGAVYSRSNKLIPNKHVQALFSKYEHLDGELIVGEPWAKDCYRVTMSGVMSVDGEPSVRLFVFDHVGHPTLPYIERQKKIGIGASMVRLQQHVVTCPQTLLELEELKLAEGYEGLILRSGMAPYKYGRSTANEGYLLKLKRFADAEFEVVGYEERMHNGNEATVDELGRTSRSSHQAGKTGRGDLGALILVHPNGLNFNVGTGFDDAERQSLWDKRDSLAGKIAKVKYFDGGNKDLPRFPVFLGWRDSLDA